VDIASDPADIPLADLTLLFNVLSYVDEPLGLLDSIAARCDGSAVAVREASSLRFGPMPAGRFDAIDVDLQQTVAQVPPFRLFDLDRTYAALAGSSFARREVEFELFERTAPFPPEVGAYLDGTLWWIADNISPANGAWLEDWRTRHQPVGGEPAYLVEVDVVAILRSTG